MKVAVTLADIESGVSCDATRCPVAIAVQRATDRGVEVYAFYFDLCDGQIPLPDDVLAFVRNFDIGEPVEPFVFEFDFAALLAEGANDERNYPYSSPPGGDVL